MRIRLLRPPCLLLLMAWGGLAHASPTVLNFEDLSPQTSVTSQYGPRGVLFPGFYLDVDPKAHSGTHVLRTSAQARVKLFAECSAVALNGTLTAFDSHGAVVARDGPRQVAADVFTTSFEVIDPDTTPSIVRAELALDNGIYFAIDDLEFDGEPPAQVPTTPPVVQITSPVNGSVVDVSTMDIAGTVAGDGLLSPVNLTMVFARPPESPAPPFSSVIALVGTGTTRQFLLPGFTGVPLGPIAVTVQAENTGALKGTGSATFTNLPVAIRDRFTAEGGAATFGAFSFGLISGCKIAVYERGAISQSGSGTQVIRGQIFSKWRALKGPFNSEVGYFGCPLGEERDTDVIGGARVQDFERGRIYGSLLGTAPPHTAYVPLVFVDALTKRGGELVNGLPRADPVDSIGASQTWLFQQFFRPDQTDQLPSTLEIRNVPPVLWVERQGGDWFLSALKPSDFDQARNKSAATLWESFPCSGNLGPCTINPEPPFPPPNTPNAGDLFCRGTTYIPTLEGTCVYLGPLCDSSPCCVPPEWVAIRGDYVATPVFGAIASAHMTDIDNGLTHETHNGNCPYFPNILEALSTITCVSDYEYFIRPIGPQGDTAPLPSLFGRSNTDEIKTEYEVAYASAAHGFLGAPETGDLIHTTGRWIIDCGHSTFKSELHPIFSYAKMKTVVSETNAFTGLEEVLFGGKPATRVAIWVNGWYPGGDNNAIEFDAFPPPRPSPDAVLHVVKPVDFAAGGYKAAEDVTLDFGLAPAGASSHVHLRFTAPLRRNTVTAAGEMMFDSGRQYWGVWYLYWGQ